MIRAIVSDFGGVLTTPLAGSFAAFCASRGIGLGDLGGAMADVTAADGENPLYALEVGAMTEADFGARVGGALTARTGRDVSMEGFAGFYFDHLQPNHELLERLARWRDGGFRLALCTNNVREWEPLWRAMLPVDDLFETVVDSGFVGVRKPDRRIYEIVLARLGDVAADECVFLDDIDVNCDAAGSIGMHPVWFRSTSQAVAEVEALLSS